MKALNFLKKYKQFSMFLVLAILIILAAVFAPIVSGGVDPLKGSLADAMLPPGKGHIFGTDKMGRDIYARVIYGARASLSATFGVVALIFLVGSTVGVIAGYFGGWIDAVLMRIADMMLAFPGLVLALAVAGIMGASIKNAIIAIVAVSWTKYARLARSLVLKIRLCVCCRCDRIKNTLYALALYASECTAYFDYHSGNRYRFHDAGTGGTFFSGIWCQAPFTGMGVYA